MKSLKFMVPRRTALKGIAFGTAALATQGLFVDELAKTPRQTEGPFFPNKLPLDTDNDLLIINDSITAGVGEITHLTGKILDQRGNPIRNAVVEIWQVDNRGAYLHSDSANRDRRDSNFQGFGRFLTDSAGQYYFRTIKPVPYPGRTPHIHFKVKRSGQKDFTTQCYVNGLESNEQDRILQGMGDPKLVKLLMVDFKPIPESKLGELAANFDIVLGHTPSDSPKETEPNG